MEKAMDKLAALCRIRGLAEQTLDALVDNPTDEQKITAALHQIGGLCTLACDGDAGGWKKPVVSQLKSPGCLVYTGEHRVEDPLGGHVVVTTITGDGSYWIGKLESNGSEKFCFSSFFSLDITKRLAYSITRSYLRRLNKRSRYKAAKRQQKGGAE